MNGACTSGEYICPCSTGADCDDDNPCTSEVCTLGQCVYTDEEGPCNDWKKCTEDDVCEDGRCVAGEDNCGEGCEEEWSCGEWGSCVSGLQSRVCTCECDQNKCSGDSTMTQECGTVNETIHTLLDLNVSTNEGLQVGDVLHINVTDEFGTPVDAVIILVRPDGTNVTLTGDEYVVDQAGKWKVLVKKTGYREAEAETDVGPKTGKPSGGVEQVTKAVTDAVTYVTKDSIRFALRLAAIAGIFALFLFLKRRQKSRIERL